MQRCDIHSLCFYRIPPQMLLQNMEQFILMIRIFHINKINQYKAGQIAKLQLSGNFTCCLQINLTVSLLHFLSASEFSAVYINRYKSLSLLYYQESPAFQPDLFVSDLFQSSLQTMKLI